MDNLYYFFLYLLAVCILLETDEIKIQNAKLIQSLGLNDENSRSPINLDISYMKVIELNPLEWNGIDIAPRKLKITNTGYTGNICFHFNREDLLLINIIL